ncbi:proline-rich transmembrane protein 4 isoform X2 [Denticeps clupeoides]|uniref:Proline-rich transmembrane protein 3/4 domain-containing protein n=1 Tax=Denticeps clupeoides TaxID=299321 RepID=A0AAY4CYF0_9TELE|nr:proline-rich transmembrane protein 4 isoform X2 [Denticeps clupeoides]
MFSPHEMFFLCWLLIGKTHGMSVSGSTRADAPSYLVTAAEPTTAARANMAADVPPDPTQLKTENLLVTSSTRTMGPLRVQIPTGGSAVAAWTAFSTTATQNQVISPTKPDDSRQSSTSADLGTVSPAATTGPHVQRSTVTDLRPDLVTDPINSHHDQTDGITATGASSHITKSFSEPWVLNQTQAGPEEDVKGTDPAGEELRAPWTVTLAATHHQGDPGDMWLDAEPAIESSSLPDCNAVATGICNTSDPSWNPGYHDKGNRDDESDRLPPVSLTTPLLVPLRSDWNGAMATWGLAWEGHVYGLGCVFGLVAAVSALCLLALPLRRPPGCPLLALVHVLQLLATAGRAVQLLYDPYGQRERLPPAATLLLYEAAFPCLTAAFGPLLLLLAAGSRAQRLPVTLLRCAWRGLGCALLLHAGLVLASVSLRPLVPALPGLALVPPGAFVAVAPLLSAGYLLFYCYARVDPEHMSRLGEASPEHGDTPPPAFSGPGAWERAAATGVFSALFLLGCGGLRLYSMLLVLGVAGGGRRGLAPWPWWGLQSGLRVCEAGLCLSIALVAAHPALCCAGSGDPGWSLRPGDKMALVEKRGRWEGEDAPLYTLADQRISEADGLDLHCPPSPRQERVSTRSSFTSLGGNADSTADLRPPSPIDLRRSIGEALISDTLFSHGLFSSSRLSLSTRGPPDGQPCRGSSAERALHRTSSCGDADVPLGPARLPHRSSHTQTERWRDSSCASLFSSDAGSPGQTQQRYSTLGLTSSAESLDAGPEKPYVDELAVQAEFISVCRQIDALSVSSDTIDL